VRRGQRFDEAHDGPVDRVVARHGSATHSGDELGVHDRDDRNCNGRTMNWADPDQRLLLPQQQREGLDSDATIHRDQHRGQHVTAEPGDPAGNRAPARMAIPTTTRVCSTVVSAL
jgi:hypothetical protein